MKSNWNDDFCRLMKQLNIVNKPKNLTMDEMVELFFYLELPNRSKRDKLRFINNEFLFFNQLFNIWES